MLDSSSGVGSNSLYQNNLYISKSMAKALQDPATKQLVDDILKDGVDSTDDAKMEQLKEKLETAARHDDGVIDDDENTLIKSLNTFGWLGTGTSDKIAQENLQNLLTRLSSESQMEANEVNFDGVQITKDNWLSSDTTYNIRIRDDLVSNNTIDPSELPKDLKTITEPARNDAEDATKSLQSTAKKVASDISKSSDQAIEAEIRQIQSNPNNGNRTLLSQLGISLDKNATLTPEDIGKFRDKLTSIANEYAEAKPPTKEQLSALKTNLSENLSLFNSQPNSAEFQNLATLNEQALKAQQTTQQSQDQTLNLATEKYSTPASSEELNTKLNSSQISADMDLDQFVHNTDNFVKKLKSSDKYKDIDTSKVESLLNQISNVDANGLRTLKKPITQEHLDTLNSISAEMKRIGAETGLSKDKAELVTEGLESLSGSNDFQYAGALDILKNHPELYEYADTLKDLQKPENKDLFDALKSGDSDKINKMYNEYWDKQFSSMFNNFSSGGFGFGFGGFGLGLGFTPSLTNPTTASADSDLSFCSVSPKPANTDFKLTTPSPSFLNDSGSANFFDDSGSANFDGTNSGNLSLGSLGAPKLNTPPLLTPPSLKLSSPLSSTTTGPSLMGLPQSDVMKLLEMMHPNTDGMTDAEKTAAAARAQALSTVIKSSGAGQLADLKRANSDSPLSSEMDLKNAFDKISGKGSNLENATNAVNSMLTEKSNTIAELQLASKRIDKALSDASDNQLSDSTIAQLKSQKATIENAIQTLQSGDGTLSPEQVKNLSSVTRALANTGPATGLSDSLTNEARVEDLLKSVEQNNGERLKAIIPQLPETQQKAAQELLDNPDFSKNMREILASDTLDPANRNQIMNQLLSVQDMMSRATSGEDISSFGNTKYPTASNQDDTPFNMLLDLATTSNYIKDTKTKSFFPDTGKDVNILFQEENKIKQELQAANNGESPSRQQIYDKLNDSGGAIQLRNNALKTEAAQTLDQAWGAGETRTDRQDQREERMQQMHTMLQSNQFKSAISGITADIPVSSRPGAPGNGEVQHLSLEQVMSNGQLRNMPPEELRRVSQELNTKANSVTDQNTKDQLHALAQILEGSAKTKEARETFVSSVTEQLNQIKGDNDQLKAHLTELGVDVPRLMTAIGQIHPPDAEHIDMHKSPLKDFLSGLTPSKRIEAEAYISTLATNVISQAHISIMGGNVADGNGVNPTEHNGYIRDISTTFITGLITGRRGDRDGDSNPEASGRRMGMRMEDWHTFLRTHQNGNIGIQAIDWVRTNFGEEAATELETQINAANTSVETVNAATTQGRQNDADLTALTGVPQPDPNPPGSGRADFYATVAPSLTDARTMLPDIIPSDLNNDGLIDDDENKVAEDVAFSPAVSDLGFNLTATTIQDGIDYGEQTGDWSALDAAANITHQNSNSLSQHFNDFTAALNTAGVGMLAGQQKTAQGLDAAKAATAAQAQAQTDQNVAALVKEANDLGDKLILAPKSGPSGNEQMQDLISDFINIIRDQDYKTRQLILAQLANQMMNNAITTFYKDKSDENHEYHQKEMDRMAKSLKNQIEHEIETSLANQAQSGQAAAAVSGQVKNSVVGGIMNESKIKENFNQILDQSGLDNSQRSRIMTGITSILNAAGTAPLDDDKVSIMDLRRRMRLGNPSVN